MLLLESHGISQIYHFAPLHYLPFIARNNALLSKPMLGQIGYPVSHFRSTSAHIDRERGFGHYVHMSTSDKPPILCAKLSAGFPHFGIILRTSDYADIPYDLCRFNIAKTRYLRREGKQGFTESEANGRYYGALQIPIARTPIEKVNLLDRQSSNSMIEVLVADRVPLTVQTAIRTYTQEDQSLAKTALDALGIGWDVELASAPAPYARSTNYADKVESYIHTALSDADWLGDGIEFDRV